MLTIAAGVGALLATAVFDMRCDDGCIGANEGLAWAQLTAATTGFLAICVALVHTHRHRYRTGRLSFLVALLCFAVWTVLLAPLGDALGI